MQMIDEQVVVVVVGDVVVVVVVVVLRGVGVVVVVVGGVVVVVVVVVPEVVVVVVVDDLDDAAEADVLPAAVAADDCDAGGIGSTAPTSDGSRTGALSLSTPIASNVQAIAPTTAPTASRPCPCCRVDPIGVLR